MLKDLMAAVAVYAFRGSESAQDYSSRSFAEVALDSTNR